MVLEYLSTQSFLQRVSEKRNFHINDSSGKIYIPLGRTILTKVYDCDRDSERAYIIYKSLNAYLCFQDKDGVVGYSSQNNYFDYETGNFHLNIPIILDRGNTPTIDFGRFITRGEITLNEYLHNLDSLIISSIPYERVFMGNI